MLSKKPRRTAASINAGSMADIAFLLLIFFLVTTTIMADKGLMVKLPPYEEENIVQQFADRNVFSVKLNAQDKLLVRNQNMQVEDLRNEMKAFVLNPNQLSTLASSPRKAIVSIQCDRSSHYEPYLTIYNEIKAAYREMRNEKALQDHGALFDDLSAAQQKEIQQAIPIVISEADPFDLAKLH